MCKKHRGFPNQDPKTFLTPKKAAKIISGLGARAVIVTGGHLKGTDLLYSTGNSHKLMETLIKGGTHGSGCTHSAAIAAQLSKGGTLVEAARLRKDSLNMQ